MFIDKNRQNSGLQKGGEFCTINAISWKAGFAQKKTPPNSGGIHYNIIQESLLGACSGLDGAAFAMLLLLFAEYVPG